MTVQRNWPAINRGSRAAFSNGRHTVFVTLDRVALAGEPQTKTLIMPHQHPAPILPQGIAFANNFIQRILLVRVQTVVVRTSSSQLAGSAACPRASCCSAFRAFCCATTVPGSWVNARS